VMKKLTCGLLFTLILAGCASHPTVQHPEQARKEATSYATEAAAVKKQIKRQNSVIEQLREQIEDAKKARLHYQNRLEETKDRLHELQSETAGTDAEQRALSELQREWRGRRDHMKMSADEQQDLVNFLQNQLRMQRGFRDQLEQKVQELRKKADQMRQEADRLESRQKADKP